jgi:biotin carboxylase
MSAPEKKTIMIVGGGEEHKFAQKAGKSLGLVSFVTDGNPEAPGLKTADHAAVVSTYDHEGTLAAARDFEKRCGKISGVMTIASDVPYTVAYVASGLGLRGISLEAARMLSNKFLMKQAMQRTGVPMPRFERVAGAEDISAFAGVVGYPVVVKPEDSRGARGVQIVKQGMDPGTAFELARDQSPTARVMVEEYLDGPQLSVEGSMVGGRSILPAVFDRNYEFLERYAPFVVENGGEMPSRFAERLGREVEDVMSAAGCAVGMPDGVVKGDLVVHKGRVKVIEIAGRLSGGFFATVATPYSTGVDPVTNVIRWALGEHVSAKDWMATVQRGACIRFAFPPPGTVVSVSGLEAVGCDKDCLYCHIFAKSGDRIQPIRSHPDRPAVVVASGRDREESVRNAERLIERLVIEVRPLNEG